MPAIKKSELYARLWKSCDDLRGGMDASEYKNYILTLLFVKYISDKYKNEPYADIEIPSGCSFDDMSKLKGQDGIGEKINIILDELGKKNEKLKPIFDAVNFNDPAKLGNAKEIKDKLTGLISNFESDDLDFRHNRANDDDVLGDAYEYLMRMFATESGKSKGQFYTPAEVSRVLAKVVKVSNAKSKKETLYDPACGSGSLLIRAAEEAPNGITIYGQESEITTAGLANLNMIIHRFPTATIMHGNTLADPKFTESDSRLKLFDYIVMNPPFSLKSWMNGFTNNTGKKGKKEKFEDKFGRFKAGLLPPAKNGDYAWMLHVLRSLNQKGRAALIFPHGVLSRGAEGELRKYFIDHGFIEGIIGLPTNLFYGTGIAASIVILDKANAGSRKGIFMINASRGFVKDGSKNRLREQDIRKITDAYLGELEITNFSRFVSNDEIIEMNEYNLNISRYMDSGETEDIQDIEGHLHGGIPVSDVDALSKFWDVFPTLKDYLFSPLRKGYCSLNVPIDEVAFKISIYQEFEMQANVVREGYLAWEKLVKSRLIDLNEDDKPKTVICDLADKILDEFKDVALMDKYDVYQVLLSYMNETMRDDLYLICGNGWESGRVISYEYAKDKSGKITKKVKSFDGLLIPKDVLANEFFPDDVSKIAKMSSDLDTSVQQIDEIIAENSSEEGLLSEVISEDGTVSLKDIRKRMKEIKDDKNTTDEHNVLDLCAKLLTLQNSGKKGLKEEMEKLDKLIITKYAKLTIPEIKHLVIEKKWFHSISSGIDDLFDSVSHKLESRVVELAKRYETTLPECSQETDILEKRVREDLEKMGYTW